MAAYDVFSVDVFSLLHMFPRFGGKQVLTFYHQENMSVKYLPPYTPLLYRKTGVCRGIPIFLIFAHKHMLWVPVRTAAARQF